jgi:hypothetical protein
VKKLWIAAAFLLAVPAVAQDDDQWTVTANDGSTWTIHPNTLRSYMNVNNTRQYDVLVEFRDVDTPHLPSSRRRYGVTGCGQPSGQTAIVSANGQVLGEIREWVADGTKVMDGVARRICAIALGRRGSTL